MAKGFYIHIDAIFDTRAGVVHRIDPEKHADIIRGGYHNRKGDFFEGIDPIQYNELYKLHEVETLMESTITNIFQFLYPQVVELMKEIIAQEVPHHEKPTLDVNVWPYDLTDDEKAQLRTLVYLQMKGVIGVNVFSRDIADLTPGHCSEHYHMVIVYDYHDYLNAHSNALIKEPKPYLMLIAPMVYFNRNPETDEETIEHLKRGINSLALLEASIASRICLKFINVDIFSILYPDDRIMKTDESDTSQFISIDELDKVLEKQRDDGKV